MTLARQNIRRRRHLSGLILLPLAALAGLCAAMPSASGRSTTTQSILVLVNDEPITGYEVEQRMKLSLLGAPELQKRIQKRLKSPKINDQFKEFAIKRLKANPPKSEAEQQRRIKQLQAQFVQSIKRKVEADFRPTARKKVLEELIDERLKLQEAKRLNVVANKEQVDRVIKGMAERNKMTPDEFSKHMKKMGANISTIRTRVKASISWADVIKRRFGRQIVTSVSKIDRIGSIDAGEAGVELLVHRILLPLPADVGQKQVAARLKEAEQMRARFAGCANMKGLATGVSGARFDDLGSRKPGSIPEPTRSLLMSAGGDEVLPPSIGEGGVELWAVCGRKEIKSAAKKKKKKQTEDRRQKEFEILSKKHLKDLRQDAHIEYR